MPTHQPFPDIPALVHAPWCYDIAMHRDLRHARPHRLASPVLRHHAPLRRTAPSAKPTPDTLRRIPIVSPAAAPAVPAGFDPDPFVDYGRWLTAEGGILIAWKDLDYRWRHMLWRVFAWIVATALDGSLLAHQAVPRGPWFVGIGLLVMAAINAWIVAKPVMRYRTLELRPDGMILDRQEMFWLRHMAAGWPAFRADEDGNQRLCGTYGTRFVEYLTVCRFDELDRTPEVFAAQLQDAMQQLWSRLP